MNTSTNVDVSGQEYLCNEILSLRPIEQKALRLRCPRCKRLIPVSDYYRLETFHQVFIACKCGELVSREGENGYNLAKPLDRQIKGVKNGDIKRISQDSDAVFYHMTWKDNWLDGLRQADDDPMVHVGQKVTSLEYGSHLFDDYDVVHFYEVHLENDIENQIMPAFFPDYISSWPESYEDIEVDFKNRGIQDFDNVPGYIDRRIPNVGKYSAFPYINVYESPGSISIFTKASNIRSAKFISTITKSPSKGEGNVS